MTSSAISDRNDEFAQSGRSRGPSDHLVHAMFDATAPRDDLAITSLLPAAVFIPDDARLESFTARFASRQLTELQLTVCTSERLDDLVEQLHRTLKEADVSVDETESPTPQLSIVRAHAFANANSTTHLAVDDLGDQRRMQVTATGFSATAPALLPATSDWHLAKASLGDSVDQDAGLRFMLEASRHRFTAAATSRYSTTYLLPDGDGGATRAEIEHCLRAQGWSWDEPTPDVLLMTGPFDAELYFANDKQGDVVTIVGEFTVALGAGPTTT